MATFRHLVLRYPLKVDPKTPLSVELTYLSSVSRNSSLTALALPNLD